MRLQPRSSSAPMASGAECLPALRTLASDCGGLRSGERCLIVTDTGADAEIVSAAETVFTTLGAAVVVVSSPPADLPGDDPPDAVGAAMLEADLIVELTSVFVGSCAARRTACEAGARYLTVPGLTWTTLRPGGPFSADFHALGTHAGRLAERFDAASDFHLTSAAGTDLRGSFSGCKGRPLWGIADAPGGYAAPPDVEVGWRRIPARRVGDTPERAALTPREAAAQIGSGRAREVEVRCRVEPFGQAPRVRTERVEVRAEWTAGTKRRPRQTRHGQVAGPRLARCPASRARPDED